MENIASIVKDGALHSEARCHKASMTSVNIGIAEIKRRRLEDIVVRCCPGTRVGDYVPFYFCPRSVMLYIIYKGNHPDVRVAGGQYEIVHLECDLSASLEWADKNGIQWAFSTSNAGALYTQFYNRVEQLELIDWDSVQAHNFTNPDIKERKQAEFLFYDTYPLHLIERFGIIDGKQAGKLAGMLQGTEFASRISVEPSWYY